MGTAVSKGMLGGFLLLFLASAAPSGLQNQPQYEDQPPAELRKLEFLRGEWKGRLEVRITYAGNLDVEGTMTADWDMDGHFLKITANTKHELVTRTAAEGRIAYDPRSKSYLGFFFFRGLATGWYAKGNFKGNDLVMNAEAIQADLGKLVVTVTRKSPTMVVMNVDGYGSHKRDYIKLTLTPAKK